MEEAFASHVFHSAAHFSLFIIKATPSHALKNLWVDCTAEEISSVLVLSSSHKALT